MYVTRGQGLVVVNLEFKVVDVKGRNKVFKTENIMLIICAKDAVQISMRCDFCHVSASITPNL